MPCILAISTGQIYHAFTGGKFGGSFPYPPFEPGPAMVGLLTAVDNVNKIIGPALVGMSPNMQKEIDDKMRGLVNLQGAEIERLNEECARLTELLCGGGGDVRDEKRVGHVTLRNPLQI